MYPLNKTKFSQLALLLMLATIGLATHAAPPVYDGGIPVIVFDEGGSGNFDVSPHFTNPNRADPTSISFTSSVLPILVASPMYPLRVIAEDS